MRDALQFVITGPNMIFNLPSSERVTANQRAEVSPSETRVPPSVKMVHPWKSLPFLRVVVRELGRFGYLALWMHLMEYRCRPKHIAVVMILQSQQHRVNGLKMGKAISL